MQGIYTRIPETNYVPREHGVAAILLFLFMVLISLVAYYYLLLLIIIIIIITIDVIITFCKCTSMRVFFILAVRGTSDV